MKLLTFSTRTAKGILRDPLNLCFGLGFPLVLIALLTAIQKNIPVPMFELAHLTPGITVFGLSFMALFGATLVAKDRESALLQRLYTTPLRAGDYIFGYILPLLPMAMAQCAVCYLAAMVLGLKASVNMLFAMVFILPAALFYIALGLLLGSILGVKQVGGICGALLTNLSAWLSGIWFDIELVGGMFQRAANVLPFVHAVELERAVFAGRYSDAWPHLWVVLAYTAAVTGGAVALFLRQMKRQ